MEQGNVPGIDQRFKAASFIDRADALWDLAVESDQSQIESSRSYIAYRIQQIVHSRSYTADRTQRWRRVVGRCAHKKSHGGQTGAVFDFAKIGRTLRKRFIVRGRIGVAEQKYETSELESNCIAGDHDPRRRCREFIPIPCGNRLKFANVRPTILSRTVF